MVVQSIWNVFLKSIWSRLANYMKGKMHVIMSKGRSFDINFKWASNENERKLPTLITCNKNGWWSNKNLVARVGVISA